MARDDVRARRAERVKQQRGKNFLATNGKYILGALIVVAVVGAAATMYEPPVPQKFAHEHPAFGMFIHGEHVSFHDPAYDATRLAGSGIHMHYSAGVPDRMSTWHVEGRFPNGQPDLTLRDIFFPYGITFNQGYLKLDTLDGHNGSEWRDEGANIWQVWVSEATPTDDGQLDRQPFERIEGDYTQHIPRDLDKVHITYGDLSEEELARQQGLIPEPQP